MASKAPKLSMSREDIESKFEDLIEKANSLHKEENESYGIQGLVQFREVRVNALNLLARLAGEDSIYYQELINSHFTDHLALHGILLAARTDYLQGFMADAKLLVSAEVFADLLTQAEVLLDHDYKDAAAVLTRAVLEDALRRLAKSHKIEFGPKETTQTLNDKLYKKSAYTLLQHKEITAKTQIGNDAAHGHPDKYNKAEVQAYLDFVYRFLAEHLK